MLRTTLCLSLLSSVPLTAQTIVLAEGAPAALQIVALPESNPNGAGAVVLQNVELLPIEITGRTLAQELDPSVARRTTRNGVARAELPGGGRVFRYRRLGGQFWGFLQIAADGAPRVVLEAAGTGAGLTHEPFADRIGIAADGLHAAVPRLAGGLHVVRLDGGTFASTGRADRLVPTALPVEPPSVMVGGTHVFFVTEDERLWRCALADGAAPADLTPPPQANAELKDEMAMSGDGASVVFLYGPRDQQRLWLLGASGAATVLPPPPSKYEEPNYLPDGPGEPAMLLNHDATRLFFIDADVRDELYLLDVTGALPGVQITDDAIFQPYIGGHILPRFQAGKLTIAIGDVAAMDWFAAELLPGGAAITNLSGTGSLLQPFPSGLLSPVQAAAAGGDLLIAEQRAGALHLRRLDPATGGTAVLHQDLVAPPVVGGAFGSAADVLVRGAGGDRLYSGGTGALFAALPAGLLLTPPSHGPQLAATWLHLPAPAGQPEWGVVVVYLANGAFAAGPFEQGVTQVAMTQSGGAVIVGNPVRFLAPGRLDVLQRPAAAMRLCVSGAGG